MIYNGISPLNKPHVIHKDNSYQRFSNDTELLVGTVCRLDSTKDLPTLLKAIPLITKKNPSIKFVIWGEGPLRDELTKLAG